MTVWTALAVAAVWLAAAAVLALVLGSAIGRADRHAAAQYDLRTGTPDAAEPAAVSDHEETGAGAHTSRR